MASLIEDQAAGLRRLFRGAHGPARIVFAGAGGCAALVAEAARGLAAAGKEVVVLDECGRCGGVAALFDLPTRFDLLQAAQGDVPLAQAVLRAEEAIRLVPAARAARGDARQRAAAVEALRRAARGADFVLVHGAGGEDGASLLLPEAERLVLVVAPTGPDITDAYARIKRLARAGRRGFEIVVARAASRSEAETVFGNLREVARGRLGAELALLGCWPGRGLPAAMRGDEGEHAAWAGELAEGLLRDRAALSGTARGARAAGTPVRAAVLDPMV